MGGAGERIDRNWRLLALEFVHRPDPRLGEPALDLEHLRIVRGDDQYVSDPERLFVPLAIDPGRTLCQYVGDQFGDNVSLFGRAILIAGMLDRQKPQTRAIGDALGVYPLPGRFRLRSKLALVKKLGCERTDIRMQSPGNVEKQAFVGSNGLLA